MKNIDDLEKIIEELGNEIIEAENQYFIDKSEDNAKYIQRIERLIKYLGRYLKGKSIDKKRIFEIELKLMKKAEILFFNEWMKFSEEQLEAEGFDEEYERERAIKTFYGFIKEKRYK